MTAGCGTKSVEYIAHRGESSLAPENTRAAALLAWQHGADAVEVDVYLTTDNRIAVIHDGDTKRVAGVDLKVSQSAWPDLQKLDVGRWKEEKYAGEKIPALEEIVATIPPGKKLYVEIKCDSAILPELNRMITAGGKRLQIVMICFDLAVAAAAKRQMADIPVYWLVGAKKDKTTQGIIPHDPGLPTLARQNGLDGLDVDYAGVDEAFVRAVKASGQSWYVWTVDDPAIARRLINWGVSGITTNRSRWLKEQAESHGADPDRPR